MMATVNLDHLVGRRVFADAGECIGHIEEIVAEPDGDDLVITEFHVGIFAGFERLSASPIGTAVLDLFRLRRSNGLYRIPWDKLDVSDVERPRLLCTKEELAEIQNGKL
jgi:sporulation protein YlmC with PRC-barrel domain